MTKQDASAERIRVGQQFKRVRPDRTVETAQVLSVMRDAVGIAHVRFNVTLHRPQCVHYSAGRRMLALDSFVRDFGEALEA